MKINEFPNWYKIERDKQKRIFKFTEHFSKLFEKDNKLPKEEIIQWMKTFYCYMFAEDKIDGTKFDSEVLDILESIKYL